MRTATREAAAGGCCATRELSAGPWGGLGVGRAAGDRLKTDVCAHSWFTPFSRN